MPGSLFFSAFSASLCSPVHKAYYSVSPPGCLHPRPGHLSASCSDAVFAHLLGYRFEGAGITVWLPGNPNLSVPHLVLERVRDASALSQSHSKSQPPGLEQQPAQPSPAPFRSPLSPPPSPSSGVGQ
uniref:Uncharacterized protein n=1 Tax=Molossus molossus TaxID=27622 RepID=A0A7J8J7E4_MOLMO|nr:hypothetical protein HJG59_009663 [Molossus molossus]